MAALAATRVIFGLCSRQNLTLRNIYNTVMSLIVMPELCSAPRRRPSGVCRRHMPCHEWGSRRLWTCAALCLLLTCLQAPSGEAVTPLTDWQNGIATSAHNYLPDVPEHAIQR